MKGYMSMCLVDSRSECNRDLIHFPEKLIRIPAVSPLLASLLLHLHCMNTSLSQFSNEGEKPCCESILQLLWKESNQQMLRESSQIHETKSKITKPNTTDTVAAIRKVSSIWLVTVWNPQEYPLRNGVSLAFFLKFISDFCHPCSRFNWTDSIDWLYFDSSKYQVI